jgi:hypothetical protein
MIGSYGKVDLLSFEKPTFDLPKIVANFALPNLRHWSFTGPLLGESRFFFFLELCSKGGTSALSPNV